MIDQTQHRPHAYSKDDLVANAAALGLAAGVFLTAFYVFATYS